MYHDKTKEDALRWLPFVPIIAGWINQDMPINEQELILLRNSYTHIYIFLADTTYEEMKRHIASHADHPVYGGYVKTICSHNGEKWLTTMIDAIMKNKQSEDN